MLIRPLDGSMKRLQQLSKVDLPATLEPLIENKLCELTLKERPLNTDSIPKRFVKSFISKSIIQIEGPTGIERSLNYHL